MTLAEAQVPLLRIVSLTKRFGGFTAVDNVSVEIRPGERFGLIGPNGSGKSTTMLAIAGAIPSARGSIWFNGETITGASPEDLSQKGISLVPEGRQIFTRLTVEENLLLGTFPRFKRGRSGADLTRVLDVFPMLSERLSFPAGRLSGGQQQQLAIARALMTRPKLMLVDEASLGLAPLVVDNVYKTLTSLREEGLTLVIVEQSLSRALSVADSLYVMREGNINLSGDAERLRAGSGLEAAYFGYN